MKPRFTLRNSKFDIRKQRERLFLMTAAGSAFTLLLVTVVLFNFKKDAAAGNDLSLNPEIQIQRIPGTVKLYALEHSVKQGSNLSDVKLKEVYWPREQVPEGAVYERSELRNMYASMNLSASMPLQREMLSKEAPADNGLEVEAGKRAVAIPLDALSGVDGNLSPGSKVDVTLTYQMQSDLTTIMIVQNAKVLSYGGLSKNSAFNKDAPRTVSNSASLEVTPEDALKIITAKKLGPLNLILRNKSDEMPSATTEFDENEVNRNADSKPAQSKNGPGCGVANVGGKKIILPCSPGEQLAVLDNG